MFGCISFPAESRGAIPDQVERSGSILRLVDWPLL